MCNKGYMHSAHCSLIVLVTMRASYVSAFLAR